MKPFASHYPRKGMKGSVSHGGDLPNEAKGVRVGRGVILGHAGSADPPSDEMRIGTSLGVCKKLCNLLVQRKKRRKKRRQKPKSAYKSEQAIGTFRN